MRRADHEHLHNSSYPRAFGLVIPHHRGLQPLVIDNIELTGSLVTSQQVINFLL